MNYIIKARLLVWCSLVFSFLAPSCSDKPADVILGWEDKHVKKIHVPLGMFPESIDKNSLASVRVVLAMPGSPGILGSYSLDNEFLTFEPAIPFTKGLKYQVQYKDAKLVEIQIPAPEGKQLPAITDVFPHEDSLPENLLKIYIAFNQAMREGVSAEHVVLIRDGKDTLKDVFLDLQPELWNYDRTLLTLWLNPGRIKRDLIPNQEQGLPLEAGKHYEIYIKPGWQDGHGDAVATGFQKKFVVVGRDTVSPSVNEWVVRAPKAGTRDRVWVHLKEPLDYQVLQKALLVLDKHGKEIHGKVEIEDDERTWRFVPIAEWQKGQYMIKVMPIIEDLAGNNLDRLFDMDNAKPGMTKHDNTTVFMVINYEKRFTVQ